MMALECKVTDSSSVCASQGKTSRRVAPRGNHTSSSSRVRRVYCLDAEEFQQVLRNLRDVSEGSCDGQPVGRMMGIVPDHSSSRSRQDAYATWANAGATAAFLSRSKRFRWVVCNMVLPPLDSQSRVVHLRYLLLELCTCQAAAQHPSSQTVA